MLEERVARLNKLVLNGWDDRERQPHRRLAGRVRRTCVDGAAARRAADGRAHADRRDRQPRGAARARRPRAPTSDREQDCVPEIDDAELPSALADSITFHARAVQRMTRARARARGVRARPPARRRTRSPPRGVRRADALVVDRRRRATARALRRQPRRRLGLGRSTRRARARRARSCSAPRTRRSIATRRVHAGGDAARARALARRRDALRDGRALGRAVRDRRRDAARCASRRRRAASRSACWSRPTARRCSSRARRTTTVVRVDAATLAGHGATAVAPRKPWALAGRRRRQTLLVTHLLGPGVTAIDPATLAARRDLAIPDVAPRGDSRLAHGQVRGLYDVAARPGTDELWVAHLLLGTDTAQPDARLRVDRVPGALDARAGRHAARDAARSTRRTSRASTARSPTSSPGRTRSRSRATARSRSSSTPTARTCSSSTRAARRGALLRPLPGPHARGHRARRPTTTLAYVDERNTERRRRRRRRRATATASRSPSTATPIPRSRAIRCPPQLRLGQHLFYSAEQRRVPDHQNHWVACATCHIEGRSDAVTWRFAQGPRDTPSNAGGMLGTGLPVPHRRSQPGAGLLAHDQHRAGRPLRPDDRAGRAARRDRGLRRTTRIPLPDPADDRSATLVARGKAIFERADVGCATLPPGPRFTDSGAGNPTLDLAGTVLLHDVGTCVTTGHSPTSRTRRRRRPARRVHVRHAVADAASRRSPPYLHDGSAATLRDVLEHDARHDGRHLVARRPTTTTRSSST